MNKRLRQCTGFILALALSVSTFNTGMLHASVAVDTQQEKEDDLLLEEGAEYREDRILIKKKGDISTFSLIEEEYEAIIELEAIQGFKQLADTATYSEITDEGIWYRANIKEGTDIEALIKTLREDEDILFAEPDYIREISGNIPGGSLDPNMAEQWYLDQYGITEAWEYLESQGKEPGGSKDVVVAVIDSGVDYTHPDLAGNMWVNTGEIPGNGIDDDGNGFVDDVYGASVVGDSYYGHSGDPMDTNGHGTHVAGIIAASANNEEGVVGVSYNTKIMAIKAAQHSGILSASDIAEAVLYAVDKGADVINMSFGGYGESNIEKDALEIAFGQAVLVAAAGNDGLPNEPIGANFGKPMYPAAYPWTIGVMAEGSTPAKNGDWLADFSNWDAIFSNGVEYEVLAPGVQIPSTLPGGDYAKWSGTSMATPVVAGIAALVRSQFPDKEVYNSRFIMGQIVGTGTEVQGITPPQMKPIFYPRVNAYAALTKMPKPDVSVGEYYLFDGTDIDSNNNGNGIADAGETIDIAQVIRNHWGKADDVVVTMDTLSSAGVPDPYVTFITDSVNYGAVGSFGTDDNGLIYDKDKVIVGVNHPFKIKISEDIPNDHVVKINVRVKSKNGFDAKDTNIYENRGTISFVARHAKDFPKIIKEDMVLTKDSYWLIADSTLIPEGVTVTVEPGAHIQFWSADPSDPYSEQQMAYLQVEGTLDIKGTAEEPVELLTSMHNQGYEIKIQTAKEGKAYLSYAKVANPVLAVTEVDHCYFYQDLSDAIYYKQKSGTQINIYSRHPQVWAKSISDSRFDKVGYLEYSYKHMLDLQGILNGNLFDSCLVKIDEKVAENNVFLKNYQTQIKYGETYEGTSQAEEWGTRLDTNRMLTVLLPKYYEGKTYFTVDMTDCYLTDQEQLNLAEAFANTLGGHVVTINNSSEDDFLREYINTYLHNSNLIEPQYPWLSTIWYPRIGYNDFEERGNFTWISGEDSNFTNWAENEPDLLTDKHIASFDGWKWSLYKYSNQAYILEVPGTWSEENIKDQRKAFLENDYIQNLYNTVKNNVILNHWEDPDVNHWMRFLADSTGANYGDNGRGINRYLQNNYWGSAPKSLVDKAIMDYSDDFNMGTVIYEPMLTTAPETAYPFVVDAYVSTETQERADKVGAEKVTFHVTFNRDMDTSVQPNVNFGPDDPTTDYSVQGDWVDARHWQGTFNIQPMTGDGYQYIRVTNAVAANDPWLVIGKDAQRFKFEVITSGTEAMKLQASGQEGSIKLMWTQDDFDLLAGYHLYRSTEREGTYERVNTSIIPKDVLTYTDTTVEPGRDYYYKFTVVKTDMTESDYSNVVMAAALDTVPPVINHTPVQNASVGLPLQIYAVITDNIGVKSATLYYRKSGTQDYAKVNMVKSADNRYSATIEGSKVQAPGLEYYIEATDGISTVREGMATAPYQITINDAPQITSITPAQGSVEGGTKIVITGTNFKQGASVTLGGDAASNVVVESSTKITAVTPAHIAETVDVTVTNKDGYSSTLLRGFKYLKTGVSLEIGNTSANRGQLVEIPVAINNVEGLYAVETQIGYDKEVLTLQEVKVGSLTTRFALDYNEKTPGTISLALAGASPVNGSGPIAYMIFKVSDSTSKTTSKISINHLALNDGNMTGEITNGTFTIKDTRQIQGNIYYYASSLPVSGVKLNLSGTKNYTGSSNSDGKYMISNIVEDKYTLSPSKQDEVSDITAYDAALILQNVVGKTALTQEQILAADVNGDGKVTTADAAKVLQKAADLITLPFEGKGSVWVFTPETRTYDQLTSDLNYEDFSAILVGDVSGNWQRNGSKTMQEQAKATMNVGKVEVQAQDKVAIPIELDLAGNQLLGMDMTLQYDEALGTPTDVVVAGIGEKAQVAYNLGVSGQIKVSLATGEAIEGKGPVLNLLFNTEKASELKESLSIESVSLNEDQIQVTIEESTSDEVEDEVGDEVGDEEDKVEDELTPIDAFILRFYETCLMRTPDEGGMAYWREALKSGNFTGASMAHFFVTDEEFKNKGLSDTEYIETMYRVFFDREADQGGLSYWQSYLDQGMTRNYVLAGFINSEEFLNLCTSFGIIRGEMILEDVVDLYPQVAQFVYRFYERCMNRKPDQSGLSYWVNGLVEQVYTGTSMAESFTNTPEFENQDLSDEEYLEVLYRMFFNREGDASGKAYWLEVIANGGSRKYVTQSFIYSNEFQSICDAYGIRYC